MKHPTGLHPGVVAATVFALAALWTAGFQWLSSCYAVILVLFAYPQGYELRKAGLLLRRGLRLRNIPYSEIEEAELPASDASARKSKVRIQLRNGTSVCLSLRDRSTFVSELKQRVSDPSFAVRDNETSPV